MKDVLVPLLIDTGHIIWKELCIHVILVLMSKEFTEGVLKEAFDY